MEKNENIIAQDLCEIKDALQTQDKIKLDEQCKILSKEIKKYAVKPNIIDKLNEVSDYSDLSQFKSLEDKIQEINELVSILTSK